MRFKQLYAGTFAEETGAQQQSVSRRRLLGLLSPFAKVRCLVACLGPARGRVAKCGSRRGWLKHPSFFSAFLEFPFLSQISQHRRSLNSTCWSETQTATRVGPHMDSPFPYIAQATMVTELTSPPPSPPASAPPHITQQSSSASSPVASQQGAHGLTWKEVVQRVPELLRNPHGHTPWKVHQVAEPCAIRVKPAALQKLGLQAQARSPGSGYDYVQVRTLFASLCLHCS